MIRNYSVNISKVRKVLRPFCVCTYIGYLALVLSLTACSRPPQLPPLPANGVILAFGDSITAGTGAGDAESYPAVLAQLTGHKVVNAGVPGEMSESGVSRLPEVLDRVQPALLILCHGGNDLLAHQDQRVLSNNLSTMIRAARERRISVVLLAVPAPDLSFEPPQLYQERATEFSLPIERTALPRILTRNSLKSDFIHPNAAGYRLLAEKIAGLLKKSGALDR